jgi:hypothetical protein
LIPEKFYLKLILFLHKSRATHLCYYIDLRFTSLFGRLVADGWCWFILREEYCWLVVGGWFVVREKYCWLVADNPSEQGVHLLQAELQVVSALSGTSFFCFPTPDVGTLKNSLGNLFITRPQDTGILQ